jgi:uncharacterized membrane protein
MYSADQPRGGGSVLPAVVGIAAVGVPAAGVAAFRGAAVTLAAVAPAAGGDMNKSTFIKKIDHPAIETAIARAEAQTSGEIRVAVMHEPVSNPIEKAGEIFLQRGMQETTNRNAVLILVAPSSQTFAVIGDEGIHQKCGEGFWQELTEAMGGQFRQGNFTKGLQDAIERAGTLLALHFPRHPGDIDELPNQVLEH